MHLGALPCVRAESGAGSTYCGTRSGNAPTSPKHAVSQEADPLPSIRACAFLITESDGGALNGGGFSRQIPFRFPSQDDYPHWFHVKPWQLDVYGFRQRQQSRGIVAECSAVCCILRALITE